MNTVTLPSHIDTGQWYRTIVGSTVAAVGTSLLLACCAGLDARPLQDAETPHEQPPEAEERCTAEQSSRAENFEPTPRTRQTFKDAVRHSGLTTPRLQQRQQLATIATAIPGMGCQQTPAINGSEPEASTSVASSGTVESPESCENPPCPLQRVGAHSPLPITGPHVRPSCSEKQLESLVAVLRRMESAENDAAAQHAALQERVGAARAKLAEAAQAALRHAEDAAASSQE